MAEVAARRTAKIAERDELTSPSVQSTRYSRRRQNTQGFRAVMMLRPAAPGVNVNPVKPAVSRYRSISVIQ
jgi:hypothetical protein